MKELIPSDLFKLLACPKCRSELKYTKDKTALNCIKCRVEYQIKQGIPILLK